MMKFLKGETHSVLLVDIASSSVGIGLAGIRTGELPQIALTIRVPFAHKPEFDFAHLETAMLFALKEALTVIAKQGPVLMNKRGFPSAINHAVISFSSPWYVSELGDSEENFKQSLRRSYPEPMQIFENESGLLSAAEKRLVQKIEDETIRAFGLKEGVAMQSFTFSFAKVIDKAFKNIGPSMFVDLSGHMTDVLTKNKEFERTVSLPVGHHRIEALKDAWRTFWHRARREMPEETLTGNVFLITEGADHILAKHFLEEAMPQARIIPFYASNGILKEMVVAPPGFEPNARLAILASYSNIFL